MTTPSQALTAAASGGLAAFATAANPFTNRAREIGVQDGAYLRLNGKTGEFVTSSGDALAYGTQLAFMLMHAKLAWQGFDKADNDKLVKGPAVSLLSMQPLPEPDRKANPDVKWQQVMQVLVRTLDGEPQMLLTAKAEKPTREIWRLVKAYGAKMGQNIDETGKNKIPIVAISARPHEMTVDDETAPLLSTGKRPKIKITVYFEKYEIVDWASEAELAEMVAEAEEAAGGASTEQPAQQAQAPAQPSLPPPPTPEAIAQAQALLAAQAQAGVQPVLQAQAQAGAPPAPQGGGDPQTSFRRRIGGRPVVPSGQSN